MQLCPLFARSCRVQLSSARVSRTQGARVASVSVAVAASGEMAVAVVSEQVVAAAAAVVAVSLVAAVAGSPVAVAVALAAVVAAVALAAVVAVAVLDAADSDVPSLPEPRSFLFRGPTSWPRDSWICRSPPTPRLQFRIPDPSEVLFG